MTKLCLLLRDILKQILKVRQVFGKNRLLNVQDDEMYWPDENASLTIGHTTVTHKGSEIKGATTILKLEAKRFKKVTVIFHVRLILKL